MTGNLAQQPVSCGCDRAGLSRGHGKGSCCTKLIGFGVTLSGAVILHDVNLHVHCGELTAIVGPNGAGKSTLFRAMLGELPHRGDLSFMTVSDNRGRQKGPVIGYVPQRLEFDVSAPITVLDLFAVALSRHPLWLGHTRRARRIALEALTITRSEHLAQRRLGMLSGGELQRVLLALALNPVPQILLLDEPVSGVDPAGIELFYRMVSDLRDKFDMSILLASHDLATVARYADRMVFINRTVLCDGPPTEVLAHELVGQTFGVTAVGASAGNAESGRDMRRLRSDPHGRPA